MAQSTLWSYQWDQAEATAFEIKLCLVFSLTYPVSFLCLHVSPENSPLRTVRHDVPFLIRVLTNLRSSQHPAPGHTAGWCFQGQSH